VKTILFTLSLVIVPALTHAQGSAIYVGDGFEAFPNVEYQGGDASQPAKKRIGMLVLTDSTLAFHACRWDMCVNARKGQNVLPFTEEAIMTMPLRAIKDITNDTQVRGATKTRKLLIGGLASDRSEEMVTVVYETASSAETPVFNTMKTQSASIAAKVKFRIKKQTPPL
jgi:hypothetical protein